MLSRTEKIGEFPLKVSRTEKELYEEFLASEEAEIAREMREYLLQAKQKPGGITFDRLSLWSRIQDRVDLWITETCSWKHLNQSQVRRAKEAILRRLKDLVVKTIREALGAKYDNRVDDGVERKTRCSLRVCGQPKPASIAHPSFDQKPAKPGIALE